MLLQSWNEYSDGEVNIDTNAAMFRTERTAFFLKPRSPFNPETVEFFSGGTVGDHDILDLYHGVSTGMGHADEIRKGGWRTLGYYLHGAIRKVPDVPMHPGHLSTARDKVPVSYSLDLPLCYGGDPFHSIFPGPGCFIVWEMDPGRSTGNRCGPPVMSCHGAWVWGLITI